MSALVDAPASATNAAAESLTKTKTKAEPKPDSEIDTGIGQPQVRVQAQQIQGTNSGSGVQVNGNNNTVIINQQAQAAHPSRGTTHSGKHGKNCPTTPQTPHTLAPQAQPKPSTVKPALYGQHACAAETLAGANSAISQNIGNAQGERTVTPDRVATTTYPSIQAKFVQKPDGEKQYTRDFGFLGLNGRLSVNLAPKAGLTLCSGRLPDGREIFSYFDVNGNLSSLQVGDTIESITKKAAKGIIGFFTGK